MAMNTLERLANENKENYLDKMKQSCATNSKYMIPFYTIGYKNILDVGCADGTLMKAIKTVNPEARVIGIDLNQDAVDLAHAQGLEVYHTSLETVYEEVNDIEFDCIIFSSVLHKISSYANANRFSALPISEILTYAYRILSDNGSIIIRDGLMDDSGAICSMKFTNLEDEKWFYKFIDEFQYPYFDYFFNKPLSCEAEIAQEFLATWTGDEKSWPKKIQEKFCILTEKNWTKAVKNVGFDIVSFFKSKEDYPKFFTQKVKLYAENGKEYFPFMTCTIIANKVS